MKDFSFSPRRKFLKEVGCVSSLLLLPNFGFSLLPNRKKPNIIFVLADDLGYGEIGCYGQKDILTPNIDRMASEGIRFTNHYSGSTLCAPSRCSLMTGLHQGHAYVRGNAIDESGQVPLPANSNTVAKYLKSAGYRTGLIGKWGLGGLGTDGEPKKQGFDYFYGYLDQRHAHNYYPEFLYRNSEVVPVEGNVVGNGKKDGTGKAIKKINYSHDLFINESIQFIEQNKNEPFFLYVALTIPHANNEAGLDGMEVPELGEYAQKNWPEPEKNKAAMISRMDGDMGKIMAKLKDLGIAENTLLIFTSDNGPHKEAGTDPNFFKSSGGLRGIKRDLYDGGIRMPTIMWWPGTITAGTTSEHVSAHWDFLPTACELAGIDSKIETDGISYAPLLMGQKQTEHEYLYWEFKHPAKGFYQAVRMGKWKAVRYGINSSIELYDLEQDRSEKTDRAKEYPSLIERVKTILHAAHTEPSFEEWKMNPTRVKQ